jgi:quercetin dioxygenase-like cupin family protein
MELKVTPWSGETPPTEEELRQILTAQELNVYRWSDGPNSVYPGHTHGYHKILYVVDGSIKFDLPTRHQTINLTAGTRLDLPNGTRHSAVVGPDGVVCLEAHIY